MAISKQDVEHVAKLARIKLTENEKSKYTQELSRILAYVDELNEVDTAGIEPMAQISGLKNIGRADEITNPKDRQNLLRNAPAKDKGFIKVKKVFE